MKLYNTIKINNHSYYINDEDGDSCYLIIGNTHALLIDLGLFKEPLLPTIKNITNKELIIVCTHGHFDHIGTIKEFKEETIYLSHRDRDIYYDNAHIIKELSLIDFNQIKDLKNHQQIELGNFEIEVLALLGHTPGSMIFLDRQNKCIYTGDAIGSGCGVWLQLFHSLDLKTYHTALQQTIDYLEKQGVDDTWHFWGGHNQQEIQSKISAYNKLDFVLMKDLEQLCLKLINSQITGIKNSAPTFDDNQAYYASYGKAEIIYQKNSL